MLKPTTPFLFSFSLAQILHVHKYKHQFNKIHKVKQCCFLIASLRIYHKWGTFYVYILMRY
jgi:hypothetical protein